MIIVRHIYNYFDDISSKYLYNFLYIYNRIFRYGHNQGRKFYFYCKSISLFIYSI